MNPNRKVSLYYSAKEGYQDYSCAEEYEKVRYSSLLGRYIYHREQNAVTQLIDMLPTEITIADCPCGTGRWWPILARRANRIIAVDISPGMLTYARNRSNNMNINIEVYEGDAENLPLDDKAVDYTFSHALTKHLPIPIQYQVLAEFARIARSGVICSFGIFTPITYEFWRWRHLKESYPTFWEELEWMANAARLKIRTLRRCTTPLGVEHTVLFDKLTE